MEEERPYFYDNPFPIGEINTILKHLVLQLETYSSKSELTNKSRQSYREWLRPFIVKNFERNTGIAKREWASEYIQSLIAKNRDFTYVVNVRLLLQKLFKYDPPLEKISTKLDDVKRGRDELFLSDKDVRAITAWTKSHISPEVKHFDELADYITIILKTGMRPFEARCITVGQCRDLSTKGLTRVLGKGQTKRDVFCSRDPETSQFFAAVAERITRKFYKSVEAQSLDIIQVFTKTDRYYRRKFLQLQKEILLFDKTKFCSLHSLRRAAAMKIYTKEKDLVTVKEFLGHKRSFTTERYLNFNISDIIGKITAASIESSD